MLTKKGSFKGIFSQRKILWGFIEELEDKKKTINLDPIESLVIEVDNENIKPDNSQFSFTTMTYAHLCLVMRDNSRLCLHDSKTFEPRYAIWQSEINSLYER